MSSHGSSKNKAPKGPPKGAVEQLRGRIAMRVMMEVAGVETANALARVLAPNLNTMPDAMESFTRTCRRYVAGKVTPGKSLSTKIKSQGGGKLVPALEWCLNSLVWEVLKGNDVSGWAILKALYCSPSNIGLVLFEPGDGHHLLDTRLREFDDHVASDLKQLSGFEAIETFVLLAAYARSIQSQLFINAITFLYMEQRSVLSEHPELNRDFRELFSKIDLHMMVRTFLSSTRKMDGHFPWEGQMPGKAIPNPNRQLSFVELAEMPINLITNQANK